MNSSNKIFHVLKKIILLRPGKDREKFYSRCLHGNIEKLDEIERDEGGFPALYFKNKDREEFARHCCQQT